MKRRVRGPDAARVYRNILILEGRQSLAHCPERYDPRVDLVLTYDLALKYEANRLGGEAFYVDHLVDNEIMQENNCLVYEFFRRWHFDADGCDLFSFRGIPFGFAFRIDIWTDFIFYLQSRICLEVIRSLRFDAIVVGTQLGLAERILAKMGIPFTQIYVPGGKGQSQYYFPAYRWMDERLRTCSAKGLLRDLYTAVQGTLRGWADRVVGAGAQSESVFVQEYYPTRKVVERLQLDPRIRVVLAHYSWSSSWWKYLRERPIPIWGALAPYQPLADQLMARFREHRCAKLVLTGDVDVSADIYEVIESRIASELTRTLRDLDCIMRYLDKHPLRLEVLIGNIGHIPTLVDAVCKRRGVPSYLIINGMVGNEFMDEGKYATVINGYSASIKKNYFKGMDNVVCLGDPRMDEYPEPSTPRNLNRMAPTVTIGASGHNNIDMNSYLAVEFEFMFEVLEAMRRIKATSTALRIVVKVRSNGYRRQYEEFAEEFFPGLVDEIVARVPMKDVLIRTDFFISIYSQTLFEASCLGIPCVYYKKDDEIMDPPFNGRSELVTVDSVDGLVQAFCDFQSGDKRFEPFLDRHVMEQYIGPLDGKNLERNLDFIYSLLTKDSSVATR